MKNKEIAELLQISPATVSLAINNKPGVSEETRRKILELREGDSFENPLRQKSLKMRVVEVLIYEFSSEQILNAGVVMNLLKYFSNRLNQNLYQMSISFISASRIKDKIQEINESDVAGVLLMSTTLPENVAEQIKKTMKKPHVFVDAFYKGLNVDTVVMDNFSGIQLAVDYAVQKGHREIGYLDSLYPMKNFEDRFSQFCISLEKNHIEVNSDYIFKIHFIKAGATEEMRELLKKHPKLPTVLIAGNDFMAVGAYAALKEAGYRIPEDVSVIGFDDIPEAKSAEPPLTSIRIHQVEIANAAVDRLIAKIERPEENSYAVHQLISVELIERGSVLSLIE